MLRLLHVLAHFGLGVTIPFSVPIWAMAFGNLRRTIWVARHEHRYPPPASYLAWLIILLLGGGIGWALTLLGV